jgi:hypothetical protein
MWRTSREPPRVGNRVGIVGVSAVVAMPRWAVGVLASCLIGAACGEANVRESAPTSEMVRADGEPDCGGEEPWLVEYDTEPDAAGETTAEAALRPYLDQWQELFGGEIVMVGADRAAWTLDDGEVVVAYTKRTNPGGFDVTGATGCDGYGPEVLPGPPSPGDPYPHTAPPASLSPSTVPSPTTMSPVSASTTVPPSDIGIVGEPGDNINVIVTPGTDGRIPPDTLVTCDGSPTFPISALEDPVPVTDSDLSGVRAALTQFLGTEEGVY